MKFYFIRNLPSGAATGGISSASTQAIEGKGIDGVDVINGILIGGVSGAVAGGLYANAVARAATRTASRAGEATGTTAKSATTITAETTGETASAATANNVGTTVSELGSNSAATSKVIGAAGCSKATGLAETCKVGSVAGTCNSAPAVAAVEVAVPVAAAPTAVVIPSFAAAASLVVAGTVTATKREHSLKDESYIWQKIKKKSLCFIQQIISRIILIFLRKALKSPIKFFRALPISEEIFWSLMVLIYTMFCTLKISLLWVFAILLFGAFWFGLVFRKQLIFRVAWSFAKKWVYVTLKTVE